VVIKPKLRSILEVVGDLSDKDASTNVVDTSVARYAEDLSTEEVNDCLNELELLGLIKMLQRTRNRNMKGKKDGKSFRLLNITKAGLEELLSN
jgi:Cdc6-like AAA superfamily ATPase